MTPGEEAQAHPASEPPASTGVPLGITLIRRNGTKAIAGVREDDRYHA